MESDTTLTSPTTVPVVQDTTVASEPTSSAATPVSEVSTKPKISRGIVVSVIVLLIVLVGIGAFVLGRLSSQLPTANDTEDNEVPPPPVGQTEDEDQEIDPEMPIPPAPPEDSDLGLVWQRHTVGPWNFEVPAGAVIDSSGVMGGFVAADVLVQGQIYKLTMSFPIYTDRPGGPPVTLFEMFEYHHGNKPTPSELPVVEINGTQALIVSSMMY